MTTMVCTLLRKAGVTSGLPAEARWLLSMQAQRPRINAAANARCAPLEHLKDWIMAGIICRPCALTWLEGPGHADGDRRGIAAGLADAFVFRAHGGARTEFRLHAGAPGKIGVPQIVAI